VAKPTGTSLSAAAADGRRDYRVPAPAGSSRACRCVSVKPSYGTPAAGSVWGLCDSNLKNAELASELNIHDAAAVWLQDHDCAWLGLNATGSHPLDKPSGLQLLVAGRGSEAMCIWSRKSFTRAKCLSEPGKTWHRPGHGDEWLRVAIG